MNSKPVVFPLKVSRGPEQLTASLWLTALVAWGCLVIICATIYWNLAVGYGWTLPIIGTVKGPPTPFQQGLFTAFTVFAALLGFGVSFRVFLKGSWLQRLAILVPLLLFLGVLGSITYEAVSQILAITSKE